MSIVMRAWRRNYFVFLALCDFVDRMAPNPKHTIHEITRNLTKRHEPNAGPGLS